LSLRNHNNTIVALLCLLVWTVSLVLVRTHSNPNTCRHLDAQQVFMAEANIQADVAALKAENALLKARLDALTAIRSTVKPLSTIATTANANNSAASSRESSTAGGDAANPFQKQLDKVRFLSHFGSVLPRST
jgi:hypothetical protein